jgi:hypothetical protein
VRLRLSTCFGVFITALIATYTRVSLVNTCKALGSVTLPLHAIGPVTIHFIIDCKVVLEQAFLGKFWESHRRTSHGKSTNKKCTWNIVRSKRAKSII